MALQKTPVSWPLVGGIATKNAPIMLAPPGHLVLDNVRQERANEWRTRSGIGQNVLDNLPGANVPVLATEAPWGGLVGLTRETGVNTSGIVYNPTTLPRWVQPPVLTSAAAGFRESCSQITPGVWSRLAVAPGAGTARSCSVAEGDGYRLTAWWSDVANAGIQVSLATTAGASLSYFAQYANGPNAIRPRCVYSSAAHMLVLVWADSGTGAINAARWDTTTGLPVGATVGLSGVGRAGADCYLDAIYYGGATVTIAFRDNVGTGSLRIAEFNPATAAVTVYTPGQNCANALALFPDPDVSGIRMVGVGSAVPEVRVVRINAVGVIQTNQLADVVDPGQISGVAYTAGLDWMIVYGPIVAGQPPSAVKCRGGASISAVTLLGPAVVTGDVQISTGAWREPGTDAMRYTMRVDGHFANADPQPTYLEMALDYDTGSALILNRWTEPQARLIPLNAGSALVRSALPQVQRLGVDRFTVCLPRQIGFEISADTRGYVNRFAIDAWSVQYLNATTYNNQNLGRGTLTQQCAYLTAGSLLQTANGQAICSHGASALPFTPTLSPAGGSAGGGMTALARYSYLTTTTLYDEAGNAWESRPSNAAADTLAAGNGTFTVVATHTPFENVTRLRTVKFWRTKGNGSTYFLVHEVTDTVPNTVTLTFVDHYDDFQLTQAMSAELQATITPAMSHVVMWNRRMYGVERDFPGRIRFSKPIAVGKSPQFPADFYVDVDDEFGGITGLAAMDDRIVATKVRATYVGGGDGPDNAGNGAYPSFNRISSTNGNIIGGALRSTGAEVYMTTTGGVFRLNRSQEFDFVGAAIDQYLSMPLLTSPETVTGIVVSPDRNEVRVQTTRYRFVHDRVFDLWERDTGGFLAASCVSTFMLGGLTQAWLTSDGHMWIESADSTAPSDPTGSFQGIIRSPWIRPTSVGGWLRLYRARVEGTVTSAGVVSGAELKIFFDDDDNIAEVFTPTVNLAANVGTIRGEGRPQRQKCTSFSLQLKLPTSDASVRLEEWWVIVAAKAGAPPQLQNTRWSGAVVPPPVGAPLLIPSPVVSTVPTVLTSQLLGTQGRNARDLMWQVKEDWKRKGWNVVKSSDGNAFANSDLWTDWTKIIGSSGGGAIGSSWILLSRPDQSVQVVMGCVVGGTLAWSEMQMFVSPGGLFTGGGATRPTATDELTIAMNQWMGTSPNGDPQFYAASWVAPDGSYTRVAWFYAGLLVSYWDINKLRGGPTGWTTPWMAGAFGTGNNYITAPPGRRATLGLFVTIFTSGGTVKQMNTPGPTTLENVEGTFESVLGGTAIIDIGPNPFSSQKLWTAPMSIATRFHAAPQNGVWGWITDQWWTTAGLNDCDTMGDHYDYIILGDMVLQWGIGVPTLGLASPSTNYPTAQWYGRNVS